MFGMKYDLSPQMLGEPTIKVAAVVVAFGAEWPERVVAGILLIGVLEAAAQSSPTYAPFASAIGYVLLIGALLIRYTAPLVLKRLRA
jgi:branched-subunit amino acid ABC-type transport system permease component